MGMGMGENMGEEERRGGERHAELAMYVPT